MPREYNDFDLAFERSGEHYVAKLLNSPTGEAQEQFIFPFSQGELRDFYSRIGQRNRSMRRINTEDVSAAKAFGGALFRATFHGELLGRLRAGVDRSSQTGRGLRLRLRLKGTPELAELPWEFLYDADNDHHLATSAWTPVVRYLNLSQSASPLRVILPLKILVVIAGPRNFPQLDAEGEWERLKSSLQQLEADRVVEVERLPAATLSALRVRARGKPFHIFHFIGHGGFDGAAEDGVLYFEDERQQSHSVPGYVLGNILRDHIALRLAVLNACEGARQAPNDPFSGVAQSLCQQGLPSVIAMQFEISDDAAKLFAKEFYAAVAECLPVDAAVAESRRALYSERLGQEWATPVLYMRSADGLLFEVAPASEEAVGSSVSAAKAEADRIAQEAKRQEQKKKEAAAKAEADRIAQEAKRQEQKKKEAAAKAETDRNAQEAIRQEQKRKEAAAKAEADRNAQEAIRQEQKRKEAAAKAEADRNAQEAIRQEQKRKEAAAKAEADRNAQEAIRQEQKRKEAAAKAEADRNAQEAIRQEQKRKEAAAKAEADRNAQEAEIKRQAEFELATDRAALFEKQKRTAEEGYRLSTSSGAKRAPIIIGCLIAVAAVALFFFHTSSQSNPTVLPPDTEKTTQTTEAPTQSQLVASPPKPVSELPVETDEIWPDPETKLVWAKHAVGEFTAEYPTYFQAAKYCKNLRVGGWSNWRLPTKTELDTVYDPDGAKGTRKIRGHFKFVEKDWGSNFWTSTLQAPGKYYTLNFFQGYWDQYSPDMNVYAVDALCVRSDR